MSKRVIKSISDQAGTLSKGVNVAKVRFSLTQWQEFIEGTIPGMKSARGTIEFKNSSEAFTFSESSGSALLRGGGIEAKINILSLDTFQVTGPVTDIPKK